MYLVLSRRPGAGLRQSPVLDAMPTSEENGLRKDCEDGLFVVSESRCPGSQTTEAGEEAFLWVRLGRLETRLVVRSLEMHGGVEWMGKVRCPRRAWTRM